MCRLVVFVGSCPRCEGYFTWSDLTQELPCLESKNIGLFGQCHRGVFVDQHPFDQECDPCAAEDEGVGDVGQDREQDDRRKAKKQRTS